MTSTEQEIVPLSGPTHLEAGLTSDDLRQLYYFMQLTRSLEDRVRALYLQGKLVGAVYSSRGQEGTAVASAYALGPDDVVAPLIRDLGASMVRGVSPRAVIAQWLGREAGPTHGRDGNLHFGDLSKGVLSPVSHLGATIPVCAGVALASRQQGISRVALAYIGDGGANTGDFHEGINFAAALRLPLVLIVENNGYAYSTPVAAHLAIRSLADRAAAYGIASASVDGNDVIATYAVTKEAVERARAGEGPTLIEAHTFRMRGHAEHDDASYVPRHLLAQWEGRDPIARLLVYMESQNVMTARERSEIDARISSEIEEAVDWVNASPMPDAATQALGVYAD
jgi:pyruvate dehydrogenase E1 component alpha subunit/2-oxoisovalerate dehydrogenase E1 component alpha subunit